MATLPEEITVSKTAQAMVNHLPRHPFSTKLDASTLGLQCPRRTWYSFRWAGGEDYGIFDTGHAEAEKAIALLRAIGCEVWEKDEANNPITFTATGGHVVVSVDAVAMGILEAPKTPHVVQVGTLALREFRQLQKADLAAAAPEQYAGMILAMELGKIERGIFIAISRDDYAIHAVRIRREEVKEDAKRLLAFAETVIASMSAPEKISDDPKSLHCRWCPYNAQCHGSTPPAPALPSRITCRNCCYSTPKIEEPPLGRWVCERHHKTLSEADQMKACPGHLILPSFVAWADPVDGDDGPLPWCEYQNKADGSKWRNGNATAEQYKSFELTVIPSPMVGQPGSHVEAVKKNLGGEAVGYEHGGNW